ALFAGNGKHDALGAVSCGCVRNGEPPGRRGRRRPNDGHLGKGAQVRARAAGVRSRRRRRVAAGRRRAGAVMIGVAVDPADLRIAEEFFELFKTPWRPTVPQRKYRVVLSSGGSIENLDADVVLIYSAKEHAVDRKAGIALTHVDGGSTIDWRGAALPVYGGIATFEADRSPCALRHSGRALSYTVRSGPCIVHRIGYDLFTEVRRLLTDGQPVSHAA